MALTQFPFETDQPQVDVTLPVGVHRLQLVVEDSAGLRSEPTTVVVTILPAVVPVPQIDSVSPDSAVAGNRLTVTIGGRVLGDAIQVDFLLSSGDPDPAMRAQIIGNTGSEVVVDLAIERTAVAGRRQVRVTTPSGVATSTGTVGFTVEAEPVAIAIEGIDPNSSLRDSTLQFRVFGTGLDAAASLGFFLPPRPGTLTPTLDSTIVATIESKSDTRLAATVRIGASSEAGARLIGVRTATGQVTFAPSSVAFEVRVPSVTTSPPITTVTPPIGVITTPPIGVISTPPIGVITTPPIGVISTPPIGVITTPPIGTITPPIGTITQPIGIITQPIGTITQPIGTITQPIGTITQPIGTISQPIGGVTPIGGISVPIGGVIPGRLSAAERSVEEVRGIGPVTGAKLAESGIGNLEALSQATPTDVAAALGISEVRAMGFVDGARALLEEPAES